ncbi:hypothetical protein MAPG_06258 [Magnaporthiopsis poae ATCC 64411]|uniref:Uncharacterized protein n=1 Tax=Magnaporthiopsis poae (strain ATCC 64411 / 73-15) TaxID=644358 RepID=A0A0C4E1J4_MAGP6|nr:hypothetical protein MAPG_06258 [Magnaporthiopsis poae ATCC 64411]
MPRSKSWGCGLYTASFFADWMQMSQAGTMISAVDSAVAQPIQNFGMDEITPDTLDDGIDYEEDNVPEQLTTSVNQASTSIGCSLDQRFQSSALAAAATRTPINAVPYLAASVASLEWKVHHQRKVHNLVQRGFAINQQCLLDDTEDLQGEVPILRERINKLETELGSTRGDLNACIEAIRELRLEVIALRSAQVCTFHHFQPPHSAHLVLMSMRLPCCPISISLVQLITFSSPNGSRHPSRSESETRSRSGKRWKKQDACGRPQRCPSWPAAFDTFHFHGVVTGLVAGRFYSTCHQRCMRTQ